MSIIVNMITEEEPLAIRQIHTSLINWLGWAGLVRFGVFDFVWLGIFGLGQLQILQGESEYLYTIKIAL